MFTSRSTARGRFLTGLHRRWCTVGKNCYCKGPSAIHVSQRATKRKDILKSVWRREARNEIRDSSDKWGNSRHATGRMCCFGKKFSRKSTMTPGHFLHKALQVNSSLQKSPHPCFPVLFLSIHLFVVVDIQE